MISTAINSQAYTTSPALIVARITILPAQRQAKPARDDRQTIRELDHIVDSSRNKWIAHEDVKRRLGL